MCLIGPGNEMNRERWKEDQDGKEVLTSRSTHSWDRGVCFGAGRVEFESELNVEVSGVSIAVLTVRLKSVESEKLG